MADLSSSDRGNTDERIVHSLRVGGLFAGIGGFEKGLALSGHKTIFLCEIDVAARAVLNVRFQGARVHEDVRTLQELPSDVDLITAGFPCQDLSQVGQANGIRGKKSSVVSHVFRLLRSQPCPWVLLENVPFMLQLHEGRAIKVITERLERLGYRWAYRTIDSRSFGIPQRRERVFLLASLKDDPAAILFDRNIEPLVPEYQTGIACGFYWTEGNRGLGWAVNAIPTLKGGSGLGIPSPPAIWMSDGSIVTPQLGDAERLQGFEAGWTEPASEFAKKGHRWKLVGNAVTIPVARWIGARLAVEPEPVHITKRPMEKHDRWPKAAFGSPEGRFIVSASTWPILTQPRSLEKFLEFDPVPLSQKATAGFLARLEASTLKCPTEFKSALRRHARKMRRKTIAAGNSRAQTRH